MIIPINLGLNDRVTVTFRDRLGVRKYHFKNLILDAGLDSLATYSLNQMLTYLGTLKSAVDVDVSNIETDFCGPLETTACGGGQSGISDWWQNSYIQSRSSTKRQIDASYQEPTFAYCEFTRYFEMVSTDFDAMKLAYTTGNDGGIRFAIGGSVDNITDMILARNIATAYYYGGNGLPYPCYTPPTPPPQEQYDIQVLENIFNRIHFDSPPPIVYPDTVINLDYTLRLDIDLTEHTQTIVIDGISTTVKTRVYVPGSYWVVPTQLFNGWNSMVASAYETNVMPAINNPLAGVGTDYSILTWISTSRPREVMYSWGASVANFATGIGSIVHGPGHSFITTFDPKIQKTNTKRFDFQPQYNWTAVGGE